MKNTNPTIIIFILLFSFFISSTSGQEGEVFVSLGGGLSLPVGDYANSNDFSNVQDGFAKPGGNFNIYFGYRMNEYFSLTGFLNGCVNRYDYIKAQEWFTKNFSPALPDTKWVVETKSWGLGGFLVGAMGSLPLIRNRLSLDLRLLGGFTYVYSPGIYVTGTESGVEDKYIDIEQSSTVSWVLDAGTGFRYNRTRSQYFILYADYMYAQPYFNDVHTKTNFGLLRNEAYSRPINNINISLGIGYVVN